MRCSGSVRLRLSLGGRTFFFTDILRQKQLDVYTGRPDCARRISSRGQNQGLAETMLVRDIVQPQVPTGESRQPPHHLLYRLRRRCAYIRPLSEGARDDHVRRHSAPAQGAGRGVQLLRLVVGYADSHDDVSRGLKLRGDGSSCATQGLEQPRKREITGSPDLQPLQQCRTHQIGQILLARQQACAADRFEEEIPCPHVEGDGDEGAVEFLSAHDGSPIPRSWVQRDFREFGRPEL